MAIINGMGCPKSSNGNYRVKISWVNDSGYGLEEYISKRYMTKEDATKVYEALTKDFK